MGNTRIHKKLPDDLKDWFYVDLDVPSGLRWKKSKAKRKKDDPAGCAFKLKNSTYYIVKLNGISYLSHRVLFFLQTGIDPGENVIDHITSDKNNKQIRMATIQQNLQYSIKRKDSKNKYKGVYFHKRDKLWAARITHNSKTKIIGYFKTEEQAAIAYNEEAKKVFKKFALLNIIDENTGTA